jgi:hypothetical protein
MGIAFILDIAYSAYGKAQVPEVGISLHTTCSLTKQLTVVLRNARPGMLTSIPSQNMLLRIVPEVGIG